MLRILDWLVARQRLVALAGVAVVFVIGAAYSVALGSVVRFHDEGDYLAFARGIRAGTYGRDGVAPSAYWPPGFPLFLALGDLVGLGVRGLRFLNFAVLGAALWFLSSAVTLLRGPRAGVITVGLILVYPVFVYTAGTLYPQTLAFCVLTGAFYLLVRGEARGGISIGESVAVGLLLGYGVLVVTALVVPLVLFVFYVFARSPSSRRTLCAAAIAVSAAAPLGGWTLRNTVSLGEVVLVSTNGGVNLLYGNSPWTTPSTGTKVDLSPIEKTFVDKTEVGRDREYREAAVSWIREHPAKAAGLYLGKFLNWFHFRNELATRGQGSDAKDLLMLVTYGPLLVLSLSALLLALKKRISLGPLELLLVAVYLAAGLFYAIFFTRIRFRIPFELAPVALAAVAVDYLFGRMFMRAEHS